MKNLTIATQPRDYIAIREYPLKDNTLTLEEKGLYAVMFVMSERGIKDLSNFIATSDLSNIDKLLKSLNAKGYIDYNSDYNVVAIPEEPFKEENEI